MCGMEFQPFYGGLVLLPKRRGNYGRRDPPIANGNGIKIKIFDWKCGG